MIPAIIAAAVAIGSAIYSGVKSAKARKAQQKLVAEQQRKNEEWYNKNYYGDYMQSADVQSGLSLLRETGNISGVWKNRNFFRFGMNR
jgi:uncharacterized protein YdgA (DUF945 family)